MKKIVLIMFFISALLVGVINLVIFTTKTVDSLVLVAVVFRHGDATPTTQETYRTDPHKDFLYFPFGRGQMTQESSAKIYQIGKYLRQRYGKFLGTTFTPSSLSAISASTVNTELSMQAILAGLYPPNEGEAVSADLAWRPIFYQAIPEEQDDYLAFWRKCKDFRINSNRIIELFNTTYVKNINKEYENLYEYMSKQSEEKVRSFLDVLRFYHIFKSQEKFGLELPKWSEKVYPKELKLIYRRYWEVLGSTKKGRKFTSGKLIKIILDEFAKKANGTLESSKKMYLFSAYDYAINGILGSMGIEHNFDFHGGRYLILELHKLADTFGIRIFYHDGEQEKLKEKLRNDCELFCPLDDIISLCSPNFSEGNCQ